MICQVYGCQSEAITDLCGKHDEDREDGIKLRMKAGGRGRPKGGTPWGSHYTQVAKRPGFRRCAALNKHHTQCVNQARPGSDFCGCHQAKAAK